MNTNNLNPKDNEMMTALMTLLEENRVLNQRMDKLRVYRNGYYKKYYHTHQDDMKTKERERYTKDPSKKHAYYQKNKAVINAKARERYRLKKEAKLKEQEANNTQQTS